MRSLETVKFNDSLGLSLEVNETSQTHGISHRGFIISIGPQTEAVLNHFGLDDSLVLDLRGMAQTIRSSRWEATLCSKWGLPPDQAAKLSNALLADIQANSTALVPKVSLVFNP